MQAGTSKKFFLSDTEIKFDENFSMFSSYPSAFSLEKLQLSLGPHQKFLTMMVTLKTEMDNEGAPEDELTQKQLLIPQTFVSIAYL